MFQCPFQKLLNDKLGAFQWSAKGKPFAIKRCLMSTDPHPMKMQYAEGLSHGGEKVVSWMRSIQLLCSERRQSRRTEGATLR